MTYGNLYIVLYNMAKDFENTVRIQFSSIVIDTVSFFDPNSIADVDNLKEILLKKHADYPYLSKAIEFLELAVMHLLYKSEWENIVLNNPKLTWQNVKEPNTKMTLDDLIIARQNK